MAISSALWRSKIRKPENLRSDVVGDSDLRLHGDYGLCVPRRQLGNPPPHLLVETALIFTFFEDGHLAGSLGSAGAT
jgi:hypothetical protein